jgi:hypothetical protein
MHASPKAHRPMRIIVVREMEVFFYLLRARFFLESDKWRISAQLLAYRGVHLRVCSLLARIYSCSYNKAKPAQSSEN